MDANQENLGAWERHLMAAVAFGEGRLPRWSWLEATPTRAPLHYRQDVGRWWCHGWSLLPFSLQPNHL